MALLFGGMRGGLHLPAIRKLSHPIVSCQYPPRNILKLSVRYEPRKKNVARMTAPRISR